MSYQRRVDKHTNLYKARELAENCYCEDVLDECPDCRPLFLALNEVEERGYKKGEEEGRRKGIFRGHAKARANEVHCRHESYRPVYGHVVECTMPACRMQWDTRLTPPPTTIGDRQAKICHPNRSKNADIYGKLPAEISCPQCDAPSGERCRILGAADEGMTEYAIRDPNCPGIEPAIWVTREPLEDVVK